MRPAAAYIKESHMPSRSVIRLVSGVVFTALSLSASIASVDDLRGVKQGAPMPACKLPALDGSLLDSANVTGSVVVYVCLSAEQKRSELAAVESQEVVKSLSGEQVRLIHVTADVVQRAYFESFRKEKGITADLAFDADRAFYGKLGLIAFPTTVIVNKQGNLDSAISLHSGSYKSTLDAHIRHALGNLNDQQLAELLAARPAEHASPRSAASAHRVLAKLMRDKGQFESARAELLKGLEIDAEDHEVLLDLADLEIAAGQLDDADAALKKVLAAQPDHRRARQLTGVVWFRRGALDKAQAEFEAALPLNPDPAPVHYYLGQIAEQRGEKDAAIEHYRQALQNLLHDVRPVAPAATSVPAPAGAK